MPGGSRPGRWVVVALALVLLALVPACGDDAESSSRDEVRTIAILRTVVSATDGQDALVDELAAAGWEEGRNLELVGDEPGEAHPSPEEAKAVVATWLEEGVDLVIALSTTSARAAAEATADAGSDVPIMFLSNNPTATGLVESERRPERNLTGATFRVPGDRTLATAETALGDLQTLGCLYPNGDPAAPPARQDLERGAAALGITLRCAGFDGKDVGPAVAQAVGDGVDGIVLVNAPGTVIAADALEQALATVRVPVIANTELAFALLVLEPDVDELYRQMARQAGRLLDGEAVADVPVEDPGRFRVRIDERIARDLGIEIPREALDAAQEVRR